MDKVRYTARWLVVSALVVLASALAFAQQRSLKVTPVLLQLPGAASVQLYTNSHALVIGASNYNNGWPKLPGVLSDVRAVSGALREQGFSVTEVLNPTLSQFETAIRKFIGDFGQDPGNRLLIYYAGHGHTLNSADGRQLGYIVPVDAPVPNNKSVGSFKSMAMSMESIESFAKQIDAKHALFIFDSCFSGTFFKMRAVPETISAKTAQPVRQFITAGGADQQVPDVSIFRQQFIAAIKGEADLNSDGYVTGSELGMFLEDRVTNYSRRTQTPQYGKIRDPNLDKGDFVFELTAHQSRIGMTTPKASRAVSETQTELALWDSVKDSRSAEELQAYLEHYPNGKFAGVARIRIKSFGEARMQVATAPATPQRPGALILGSGNLRAQGTYPTKDRRHTAFIEVIRDISAISAGAVNFEPLPAGAIVPAVGALDAVAKRTLDAAWVSGRFFYGKDHTFGILEGAPFGLDPGNYVAWRSNRQVIEIVERLYRQHGVVGLACGVTAPHGDIWVKKPITKLNDLKGLKIRAVSLQVDMFTKVGAAVNALPSGEVAPAMDRGLLDAAIHLDPRSDLTLGLADVSKMYMIGQIQGAYGLDLIINAALWDGLQPDARNAIATACRSNLNKMVAESTRIASEAIQEMQTQYKVKIYKLPDSVSAGLRSAWNTIRSEEMAKNATFAELAATMTAYDSAVPRPNLSAYGLNRPRQTK